jgi:Skp family chaperone for outer membrane proteins
LIGLTTEAGTCSSLIQECESNLTVPAALAKEYKCLFERHASKMGDLRSTIEQLVAQGGKGAQVMQSKIDSSKEHVEELRKDKKAWTKLKAAYCPAKSPEALARARQQR